MKRTPEQVAKILGVPVREVVAVEPVDEGTVVAGTDGHRLIVFDDESLAWYGYGDKPPNYTLDVFNPATKELTRPAPPAKATAKK